MSQYDWDFGAPTPSGMGDHDVPLASDRLAGRRVALLVTGGIAAMKTPELARGLRRPSPARTRCVMSRARRWNGPRWGR